MTLAASRLLRATIAALPAAALIAWHGRGAAEGRTSPIETFKWGAAAVVLWGAAFVVATAAMWMRRGVRHEFADFVHRHRRAAAATFGVAVAAVLVGAVELACLSSNQSRETLHKESGVFTRRDPLLGYSLMPGAEASATCSFGDEPVYRATYSIDERGRRRTVAAPRTGVSPRTGARAVAFFGCSATFGEGLSDGETIPSAYARIAATDLPVNFGVPGHGPNHALARLDGDEPLALPESARAPVGVYLFIDAHVGRATGSMSVVNAFGSEAPYYARDGERLALAGDFLHDRPVRAVVYWLLGKSQTLRRAGFDWPPAGRDEDVALAADLIVRCAEAFRRRTDGAEFAMAVYPGSALGGRVAARVREAGVRVLDCTDLFDPAAPGLSFPHDGHPTAAAAERVAARLAADLR